MDKILEITSGKGGNAYLLAGGKQNALIDCGMAYCAQELIGKVRQALNDGSLDFIVISHSHYDHVGAIPYIKECWPECKVLGAEYAQKVLNSATALKAIRDLGEQAARIYGAKGIFPYDDSLLKADQVIREGDILDLGNMRIQVMETPGHTKCSLSFLVNDDILFPSESTGYMSKSGRVYPAFITSGSEALKSIQRCREMQPRVIYSPHYGLLNESDTQNYWENCEEAVLKTVEFVRRLAAQGMDEAAILIEYEKKFRDGQSRLEQPFEAFRLNNAPMIKGVLREGCEENRVIR